MGRNCRPQSLTGGILDTAGASVHTVRRQDLAASRPPDPGTSHRVTVAGRAIVTVLAADGDLLTVRDATRAESARVVAAERAWPA